jgi:signal transduction histidine kinase
LPDYIKVESDITEIRANVFADPTQLFRVFLNLILNGVRSMEHWGGIFYTGLRVLDGTKVKSLIKRAVTADNYAVVTFKDTGLGMNSSLMQKIFDPFFTTMEAGKGTGLGLSVVHEIVTGMEGEIIVSSEENEGSVFDLYLPLFKEITGYSKSPDDL